MSRLLLFIILGMIFNVLFLFAEEDRSGPREFVIFDEKWTTDAVLSDPITATNFDWGYSDGWKQLSHIRPPVHQPLYDSTRIYVSQGDVFILSSVFNFDFSTYRFVTDVTDPYCWKTEVKDGKLIHDNSCSYLFNNSGMDFRANSEATQMQVNNEAYPSLELAKEWETYISFNTTTNIPGKVSMDVGVIVSGDCPSGTIYKTDKVELLASSCYGTTTCTIDSLKVDYPMLEGTFATLEQQYLPECSNIKRLPPQVPLYPFILIEGTQKQFNTDQNAVPPVYESCGMTCSIPELNRHIEIGPIKATKACKVEYPVGNMMENGIYYNQNDSSWGSNFLGFSKDQTISSQGCYLTDLAMLLKGYGLDPIPGAISNINPLTLNNFMTKKSLFDDSGAKPDDLSVFLTNYGVSFIHTIVEPVQEVEPKEKIYCGVNPRNKMSSYEYSLMDNTLQNCEPLLVMQYPNGQCNSPHWVMVLGKDHKGYKILDPNNSSNKYLNGEIFHIEKYTKIARGDI